MKRPDDERPGSRAGERRRQFEESRGLGRRRELPLDEEDENDEAAEDEKEEPDEGSGRHQG